jgi:hypothetical protein
MRALLRIGFAAIVSALVVLIATPARAHAMRSGSLRIEESNDERALVQLRQSVDGSGVEIVVPNECTSQAIDALSNERTQTILVACDGEIAGRTFGLRGLGPILEDVTVFVQFRDGRTASHLLTKSAPDWELPRAQTAWEVAKSYVWLGVTHIATGFDHLAFLALLVLLLRKTRAVLLAETAFTASHSISFTATALGWIHVPSAAAEACIAFSLVLLALDVPFSPRGVSAPDPDPKRGVAMAFVFGLVHGLGFAGGLRELGVPDRHVALAMVGFAGGVEIGQVAFLVVVLGLVAIASRVKLEPIVRRAGVYALGVLACSWLFERVAVCLGV